MLLANSQTISVPISDQVYFKRFSFNNFIKTYPAVANRMPEPYLAS